MLTGLIGDGLTCAGTCASAGHAPEGDIERLRDVVISVSLFFSIFLYFAIFVYSVPGVFVLTVTNEKAIDTRRSSAELAKHLARHGVNVTLDTEPQSRKMSATSRAGRDITAGG